MSRDVRRVGATDTRRPGDGLGWFPAQPGRPGRPPRRGVSR